MRRDKKKVLSIIVPVYNEEKTVALILKTVSRLSLPGIQKDIVVVNDGSSDGTAAVLRKIKIPGVRIFQHEKNRGKGAAIRTAIPHTRGDFVIIQDADLEYDPNDYRKLLEPLIQGRADVVYGSRFRGVHRAFMFWHSLGNKFLTFVTNLLYDTILTDMETCYKVFRGEVLRGLTLRSDRFEIEPEMTAKILKAKCRVFEVPISYSGRGFEEGKKITWKDGFGALATLVRYRFLD
ncbi:MAG TPA: glycosyltransferase family 2 protein [bacterium]|nr:glycosyltransferase family 2 protein [bacterium]